MTAVSTDAEAALRTWLRLHATTVPSGRIAVGKTSGDQPTWSLHRIGGADDPSDAPIDRPGIQIDVWGAAGPTASRSACRASTDECRALMALLRRGGVRLDGMTVCDGADLLSDLWQPDEDDRPRYVLSYLLTARTIPQ